MCLKNQTTQADLREIFKYIAVDLQSVQNAAGQLERLEKAIASLNQMPERFRVYDKPKWRERNLRIMPVGNYLVFYIPKKLKYILEQLHDRAEKSENKEK